MNWCGALAAIAVGVAIVPSVAAAKEMVVSPDGHHVYATARHFGSNGLWALRRDVATGALSPVASYDGEVGDTLAISPDGRSVYLGGARWAPLESRVVTAYHRDAGSGGLTRVQEVLRPHTRITDVEVSPDGKHVYVADNGAGDSLLIYDRNPATSALTLRASVPGAAGPLAISADGARLFVARDGLQVYDRAGNGSLTLDATVPCENCSPKSVALAPGGNRAYLGPAAIAPFSFDGATWTAGAVSSPGDGSYGEEVPGTMAVAGDDTLYAVEETQYTGGRLHQLRFDGSAMQLQRTYRELRDGVNGLRGLSSIAISPDGRHLYARGAEAIPVFSRLPGGDLVFTSVYRPPEPRAPVPFSIEINGGAAYTRDRDVRVTASHELWRFPLRASNDGGLKPSKLVTWRKDHSFKWKLDTTGPERLPKTVYVSSIYVGEILSDSIILDETVPKILAARRSGRSRLKVRARDRISGVRAVQIARNKRKPGRWRRYSRKTSYRASKSRVYVRVRDRAGNRSRWRVVRRKRR